MKEVMHGLTSPYTDARYSLVECKNCLQLNTRPRPSDVELSLIYKSKYVYSLHAIIADEKSSRARRVLKQAKRGPRGLLDLGCGVGSLLLEGKKLGYSVSGCEIDLETTKRANLLLGEDLVVASSIENFLSNASGLPEVTVMSHSLEHLLAPGQVLERVFDLMPIGGQLLLALPDADVGLKSTVRRYWGYWQVPVHTIHFRRQTFITYLEGLGFSEIRISGAPFDFLTLGATIFNVLNLKSDSGLANPSGVRRALLVVSGFFWRTLFRFGRSEMVIVAQKLKS